MVSVFGMTFHFKIHVSTPLIFQHSISSLIIFLYCIPPTLSFSSTEIRKQSCSVFCSCSLVEDYQSPAPICCVETSCTAATLSFSRSRTSSSKSVCHFFSDGTYFYTKMQWLFANYRPKGQFLDSVFSQSFWGTFWPFILHVQCSHSSPLWFITDPFFLSF